MPRTHVTDDGATLRFTVTGSSGTTPARVQITHTRYERERDGEVEVLERDVAPALVHAGRLPAARRATPACSSTSCSATTARRRPGRDVVRVRAQPRPRVRSHGVGARPAPARGPGAGRRACSGLDQAIYGEKPKVEIVAEADADGLDLGDVDLDLDDPVGSRLTLDPDDEATR